MPATAAQSIREAIDAGNRDFMAAVRAGNAAGIAALFTADAVLLPPNSDFVRGNQAIQAFYQAGAAMGIESTTIETISVEAHGETAIELGKYTLHARGGITLDHGKYIVIWKNDGGRWKLHHDIWNSSRAPG